MAISEIVLLALNERKFKNYSAGCQSSAKKFETLVMLVCCVLCCLDIYIICFIDYYCGVFFFQFIFVLGHWVDCSIYQEL